MENVTIKKLLELQETCKKHQQKAVESTQKFL